MGARYELHRVLSMRETRVEYVPVSFFSSQTSTVGWTRNVFHWTALSRNELKCGSDMNTATEWGGGAGITLHRYRSQVTSGEV